MIGQNGVPWNASNGTSAQRVSSRTSFAQASSYPPKLVLNLSKWTPKTSYLKIRPPCIRKYVDHKEMLTQLKQRSKGTPIVKILTTRKCTNLLQYNGLQVQGQTHRELYS